MGGLGRHISGLIGLLRGVLCTEDSLGWGLNLSQWGGRVHMLDQSLVEGRWLLSSVIIMRDIWTFEADYSLQVRHDYDRGRDNLIRLNFYASVLLHRVLARAKRGRAELSQGLHSFRCWHYVKNGRFALTNSLIDSRPSSTLHKKIIGQIYLLIIRAISSMMQRVSLVALLILFIRIFGNIVVELWRVNSQLWELFRSRWHHW